MDDGSAINLTTYFTTSPVYTVTTNPLESNYWCWWMATTSGMRPQISRCLIDSSWTPPAATVWASYSPQYPWSSNTRFNFSSWSDGGAETHNVTLPGSRRRHLHRQHHSRLSSYGLSAGSLRGLNRCHARIAQRRWFLSDRQPAHFTRQPNIGWTFTGWVYDLERNRQPAEL